MHYKILAVDDNPINLDLLEKSLVDSRYTILRTTSGEEALKIAAEERPDLILLDVMMPHMDGFEVCRKLQAQETTRFIPVIFLSAKNEVQFKARGLALGGIDYLTKPFNPLELNARVRSHLSHRQNNLEILHRIKQLQQNMFNGSETEKKETSPSADFLDLKGMWNENILMIQNRFAVASKVVKDGLVSNTVFMPFYPVPDQLLYVTFAGKDKTVPGKMVQLMLKSFIDGYLKSAGRRFRNGDLVRLFESVLQAFSPDIYGVGFTFSLGCIDLTEQEYTLFAIHQALPFILDTEDSFSEVSGADMPLHSGYNEFVNTVHCSIKAGSLFVILLPKSTKAALQAYKNTLPGMTWQNEKNIKENINLLSEYQSRISADRLIAVIKTFPSAS
jgi:DNA-binding response OmpR family regulator